MNINNFINSIFTSISRCNYLSIVYESKSDGFSPADTILGLKLIDVNTAEDIYIDQLLIEEGRATLND